MRDGSRTAYFRHHLKEDNRGERTMRAIDAFLTKYPDLAPCEEDIQNAYGILEQCFRSGGKLLICGNGGSASDSEHIVGELMKGFMLPRKLPEPIITRFREAYGREGEALASKLQGALPAISLVSHAALVTAIANDTDAALAYAQQVYGYGRPGDVLLAISTSGNSKNVVNAVKVAGVQGLKTIGLTGARGGQLTKLCDVCIRVPYHQTFEIQERHLPVYHALCIGLEEAFFGS